MLFWQTTHTNFFPDNGWLYHSLNRGQKVLIGTIRTVGAISIYRIRWQNASQIELFHLSFCGFCWTNVWQPKDLASIYPQPIFGWLECALFASLLPFLRLCLFIYLLLKKIFSTPAKISFKLVKCRSLFKVFRADDALVMVSNVWMRVERKAWNKKCSILNYRLKRLNIQFSYPSFILS